MLKQKNKKTYFISKNVFLFVILFLFQGCSLFTSYPPKINKSIENLKNQERKDEIVYPNYGMYMGDSILFDMEKGRINEINGKIDESIENYQDAIEGVKGEEERAIISVRDALQTTGAIIVNDNVIKYKGKAYEKVMLHTYQSLNYLMKNKIEDATPEARMISDYQDALRKKYEAEVAEYNKDYYKDPNVKSQVDNVYNTHFNKIVGKGSEMVKNAYENAFAYYIAGMVFELHNEPTLSFLDYKNAVNINPRNPYFQQEAIKLAIKLNERKDLNSLRARFPNSYYIARRNMNNKNQGEVLILIEDNFVSQKEEKSFELPTRDGVVKIAWPIFKEEYTQPDVFNIQVGKRNYGNAFLTSDINAISYRAFRDELPEIMTREIARIITRLVASEAYHQLNKNYNQKQNNNQRASDGEALALAIVGIIHFSMMFVDLFTVNVDLRGWYTLPKHIHMFRTFLPEGKHNITIQGRTSKAKHSVEIDVKKGMKNILRVYKADGKFYTNFANVNVNN